MSLPKLKDLVLLDTPFADLMNKRIYNVLLIATKYDAFMLEDDGRIDEQIFNEYTALSLRYPPRFTQVTTKEEALTMLSERQFQLIIVMPNMDNRDIFADAKDIKNKYEHIPIVVLTPFSKEVSKRVQKEDLSSIDYVFSWLGNAELLLAFIKLIEDKWNAPNDVASVGVQIILLVEDSVRFYSSALPHLYRFVLEQSMEFSKEALNDHLKTLRMRGRPKIMLARTYEEAMNIYKTYSENILGVVSDMSFMRCGMKDNLAGFRLASHIKRCDPHVPIILESSEVSNRCFAQELRTSFIPKNSKSYPQDLRKEIMQNFGFGDFVILNPETGSEVMRIRNLKELQDKLFDIPNSSLRYHLSHNHFSRFFFSRAMFPPAQILKKIDVLDYDNMEEARTLIADLIASYRKMKNEGVVANYQKERFDEYANFVRIGNGSLGGKGRGLAFMGTMVKRYPRFTTDNFTVNIPKTLVIATDIFDRFMEENNLYPIALSENTDEDILAAFEHAQLPQQLIDDLDTLYHVIHGPMAVRSSSLLEDSHYQPFAGIYSTYMIPRAQTQTEASELLQKAIKGVYASVFYKDSKAYLTATQNLIDQEKMAIVIQEVVGSEYGEFINEQGEKRPTYFYPILSGVARSLNFYPIGNERAEDGIASLALGLGKYIVDGGVTLRVSPKHPNHILQMSDTEMALRETQTRFNALDLTQAPSIFSADDAFNLKRLSLKDADAHGALKYIASTYDPFDGIIRDSYYPGGRKIISFASILQHEMFPLASIISSMLEIGAKEMGRPVEIEFAMDIKQDKVNNGAPRAEFYLLQIRPIVDSKEVVEEDLSLIPQENTIITTNVALGNGIINDVSDIVYVKSANFNAANNDFVAREIESINQTLAQHDRSYVLVGPGRWGSSDSWLGIPVKWPHISAARLIVECGLENYRIDPSQGTHFFQNLTSFGVGYFTINPYKKDGTFDEEWLNALPAETETEHVRHVKLSHPIIIKMDGRNSRGVVMK
ncbi:MAG: phosphoenolpyruvate synthase [Bacteroidaceae bacterium]|nr:phosphoenolpyruvate synthase [Bacteroidaceae bacterium]